MKKLLFWMVLIVGIVVLIGSCAKKDDDTAATADNATSTTSTTKYMSTTTTASGSITMGDDTLSGVYASECFANVWPSEVKAYGNVFVVTGSDNISIELYTFTDTSCSTSSMSYKTVSDNVTVGSASGSNYPVTYNNQTQAITVHTTAAETTTETLYSNIHNWTVGTPLELSMSGQFKYGLWTLSGTTWYEASDSTSATPTSAGTVPHVKQ